MNRKTKTTIIGLGFGFAAMKLVEKLLKSTPASEVGRAMRTVAPRAAAPRGPPRSSPAAPAARKFAKRAPASKERDNSQAVQTTPLDSWESPEELEELEEDTE